MPQQLRADTDFSASHIQVFLLLRFLHAHLTAFSGTTSSELRATWTFSRSVDSWQKGASVATNVNSEMILCNVRSEDQMAVRHVLVDPDYFLLV